MCTFLELIHKVLEEMVWFEKKSICFIREALFDVCQSFHWLFLLYLDPRAATARDVLTFAELKVRNVPKSAHEKYF